MDLLLDLLPEAVGGVEAGLLTAAAAAGAALTTALGIGGGLFLLTVMTPFIPVTALIPLHGAVQAAANGWRLLVLLRHVHWPVVMAFSLGALAGVAAASPLVARIPAAWLELVIAGFILYALWGPASPLLGSMRRLIPVGGAVTGALTLFVGATGPLVASVIATLRLERFAHMGTFSACMLLQHTFKLIAFALVGVALADYLGLLVAMIGASLVGTLVGRLLLGHLPERLFRRVLVVVLTLLALRLLWSACSGLLAGG